MTQNAQSIFDYQLTLPDDTLTKRAKGILGFEDRYRRKDGTVFQAETLAKSFQEGGRTFLVSPLTAAATAVAGVVTDPRVIV